MLPSVFHVYSCFSFCFYLVIIARPKSLTLNGTDLIISVSLSSAAGAKPTFPTAEISQFDCRMFF
jgi:hypothetical protein